MKSVLINALKQAGHIQMQRFGKVTAYEVKESISSIVTAVDLESEKKIIGIISASFPNHNILSEECGYINKQSNYTWVIDPIDGTSNFAAGIPWFGVLIALFESGIPVLSGAYLPVSNDLYLAEKGKGAYKNDMPLKIGHNELSKVLFAFSTDYTTDAKYLNKSVELYKFIIQHARNVRSTNSLVDMLYVAEGKFGGCLNMYTKIWDIAAPYLLIKEAGGLFKDLDLNDIVFDFTPENMLKNYGIITGNTLALKDIENYLIEKRISTIQ